MSHCGNAEPMRASRCRKIVSLDHFIISRVARTGGPAVAEGKRIDPILRTLGKGSDWVDAFIVDRDVRLG
jgi:hypothetical protein